jgi:hypothetical protein
MAVGDSYITLFAMSLLESSSNVIFSLFLYNNKGYVINIRSKFL